MDAGRDPEITGGVGGGSLKGEESPEIRFNFFLVSIISFKPEIFGSAPYYHAFHARSAFYHLSVVHESSGDLWSVFNLDSRVVFWKRRNLYNEF